MAHDDLADQVPLIVRTRNPRPRRTARLGRIARSREGAATIGRALALIAVGLGGWLGYRLLAHHGRLLLRLEALEAQLAELGERDSTGEDVADLPVPSRPDRTGLPPGTPAPAFRAPRVDGGELSLDEFRGRRVLLVFTDPSCEAFDELAPELELLHRRAPSPRVLMVGRADPAVNRAKVAQHGLTFPVVLQRRWEISREYGTLATPIGYLLDEQGIIAADPAVGADAILALVAAPAPVADRGVAGTI